MLFGVPLMILINDVKGFFSFFLFCGLTRGGPWSFGRGGQPCGLGGGTVVIGVTFQHFPAENDTLRARKQPGSVHVWLMTSADNHRIASYITDKGEIGPAKRVDRVAGWGLREAKTSQSARNSPFRVKADSVEQKRSDCDVLKRTSARSLTLVALKSLLSKQGYLVNALLHTKVGL